MFKIINEFKKLEEKTDILIKEKEEKISKSSSLEVKRRWYREKEKIKEAKDIASRKVEIPSKYDQGLVSEHREVKSYLEYWKNLIKHIEWSFIG